MENQSIYRVVPAPFSVMTATPGEPTNDEPLWEPSLRFQSDSNIRAFSEYLKGQGVGDLADYKELWNWSVSRISDFWESIWKYFQVSSSDPPRTVLERKPDEVFGAKWYPDTKLNYAEHIFRCIGKTVNDVDPAIIFSSELRHREKVSWKELKARVASIAASLQEQGIKPGDRVVALLPNAPEAVICALATVSLGAVWSSCSPDFGTLSVVERFRQIEPKVLIAVDGYSYGGKVFDKRKEISEIQKSLPTLTKTILVAYTFPSESSSLENTLDYAELVSKDQTLHRFVRVPFDHPLWILFSSGTTGPPKAIVHGHGGILLEHLKFLSLHLNLKPRDRFFWFTTTGWMMWNLLVSGLLLGSTIVLFDGSPSYPDMSRLWQLAEDLEITCFGASAAFIGACMKAKISPRTQFKLPKLTCFGSTGSPLSPESFSWVYSNVKRDLWLASVSGGTDLCTAFVGGCPLLPVYSGEIQCRCLGAKVEAFDETGQSMVDEPGELVITEPMPSMPVSFWNDPEGSKYREAYFETFPGVWRHGDWIRITSRGSCVIYGRSDSTLKRHGIRIGTAELYRVVEALPEVHESLVVDLEGLGGESSMLMFVVLKGDQKGDVGQVSARIKTRIAEDLSRRHVPDEIYFVAEIPKTLNGKKLEVPVRKILMGVSPERALNLGSLGNPSSIQFYVDLANKRKQSGTK